MYKLPKMSHTARLNLISVEPKWFSQILTLAKYKNIHCRIFLWNVEKRKRSILRMMHLMVDSREKKTARYRMDLPHANVCN